MGRDSVISLESVPVCILVGTVLGFLSGLGVGGGSLLILWLTAVLSMELRMAQGACAAGLCAWAATALNTELLRKLFGGLLVLTGLWELFGTHRRRKDR